MALVSNLFHVDEKTQQDLLRALNSSRYRLYGTVLCENAIVTFSNCGSKLIQQRSRSCAVLLPVSVHRTATAAKLDRQRQFS